MSNVAPKMLLSYDYGNQAERSRIEVSSTGAVKHIEVLMSGQRVVKTKKLDATQLATLKSEIEAASSGKQSKLKGEITAMGSYAGDFFVNTQAGKKVTVVNITRADAPNGTNRDKVVVNTSAAAKKIFDFVVNQTDVDMPRR